MSVELEDFIICDMKSGQRYYVNLPCIPQADDVIYISGTGFEQLAAKIVRRELTDDSGLIYLMAVMYPAEVFKS